MNAHLKKRMNLVSIVTTVLVSGAVATSVNIKYNIEYQLEDTKTLYVDGKQVIASVWSSEKARGKKVLIPPYALMDENGDYHVDKIEYASNYKGIKLSKERADSLFSRVMN